MEATVRTTRHCAGSKPRGHHWFFHYLVLWHLLDNGEITLSVSLASGIIIHDNTLLLSPVGFRFI